MPDTEGELNAPSILRQIAERLSQAINAGGFPAVVVGEVDGSVNCYIDYGDHLKRRPDVGVCSTMVAHLAISFSEIIYRDIERSRTEGLYGITREQAAEMFLEQVANRYREMIDDPPERELTIVRSPRSI